MKPGRLILYIVVALSISILLPAQFALTAESEEVIGLITELSPTKQYIQVKDYGISKIGTVMVKSSATGDAVAGDEDDLAIGVLVKTEIQQQKDGSWSASVVTVYTDDARDALLEEIGDTQSTATTENSLANALKKDENADEDAGASSEEDSADSSLRFENGVWKN